MEEELPPNPPTMVVGMDGKNVVLSRLREVPFERNKANGDATETSDERRQPRETLNVRFVRSRNAEPFRERLQDALAGGAHRRFERNDLECRIWLHGAC